MDKYYLLTWWRDDMPIGSLNIVTDSKSLYELHKEYAGSYSDSELLVEEIDLEESKDYDHWERV